MAVKLDGNHMCEVFGRSFNDAFSGFAPAHRGDEYIRNILTIDGTG
jgi:hypothetical protein